MIRNDNNQATSQIETLRAALRAEVLKMQVTENKASFGGISREWCPLTMRADCLIDRAATLASRKVIRKIARQLIDAADITASMGGANCTSYATAERHMIAELCNASTRRGWLASDPTN